MRGFFFVKLCVFVRNNLCALRASVVKNLNALVPLVVKKTPRLRGKKKLSGKKLKLHPYRLTHLHAQQLGGSTLVNGNFQVARSTKQRKAFTC